MTERISSRMRAVRMQGFGGPEVLRLEAVPVPTVRPRDVLVAVHSASVNPVDTKIRRGALRALVPRRIPWTLGLDVSGVVVEVGSAVRFFQVGDAVFGSPAHDRPGSYAEFVAVDASRLVSKPEGLTHSEAAGLPLVFATAWECLVRRAGLQRGQAVLVHAGAGGVGSMAIQIARHLGAHIATTASPRNHELVRSLGADEVIDYRSVCFEEVLSDVDVILDGLTWDTQLRGLDVLRPGGQLVTITSGLPELVARHGPWLGLVATGLRMLRLWFLGWRAGRTVHAVLQPGGGILEALPPLLACGSIRPVVDRSFALEAVGDAHRYSETGHARGKITISVRAD